jgi:hypothetical protein
MRLLVALVVLYAMGYVWIIVAQADVARLNRLATREGK